MNDPLLKSIETEINKKRNTLKAILDSKVRSAKEHLSTFFGPESLENPSHALEWSDSAFNAAAAFSVYSECLRMLNAEVPLSDILKHAEERTIKLAKYPPNSSSVPSNLMHLKKTAAYAEVLERITEVVELDKPKR